jgi:hypothetical protein
MSEKGFKKLDSSITKEYEKKGYSKRKAEYIGRATAGKVAREKRARRRYR